MLKKLPGGGALHCDKVWGCGEPHGPDSLQKRWFEKNLPVYAEEVSSVYTEEISSVYTECTQTVSTKRISSVYTEKISSVYKEEISSFLLCTQKKSPLRAQEESSKAIVSAMNQVPVAPHGLILWHSEAHHL